MSDLIPSVVYVAAALAVCAVSYAVWVVRYAHPLPPGNVVRFDELRRR